MAYENKDLASANLNLGGQPNSPMDTPQPTPAAPTPQQYPQQYIQAQQYASAPASSGSVDPKAFQTAINQMRTKMESNNKLINAKNAVFKHMYDQPLTDEEKQSLTPALNHAISTGNRSMIDAAISDVTNQIKGYNGTIDTNLSAYSTAVQQADKLKQDTLDSALKYQVAGVPATETAGLMSNMGIDPTSLGFSGSVTMNSSIAPTLAANNNPGALTFVGQAGATQGSPKEGGGYWAKFDSPESGYQALVNQVKLDASRGETLAQYVTKFAPPNENNTAAYIQQMAQSLGISINSPLSSADATKVAQFQMQKESGSTMEWAYPGATTSDGTDQTADPQSQSIIQQAGISLPVFNYLTQGTSSMSRMTASQRTQIMNQATDFLNKNGLDVSTFQSQYKTYNDVLSSNIQRQNKTTIMEKELSGTVDNLQTVVTDAGLKNVNVANVAKVLAGQQVNDSNATQYAFHFQQLKNELAGYFAASQGKASPDVIDNQDAAATIVNGMSTGSLKGFKTSIENSTSKMKTVLNSTINESRKSIWDLFGVADEYKETGVSDNSSDNSKLADEQAKKIIQQTLTPEDTSSSSNFEWYNPFTWL